MLLETVKKVTVTKMDNFVHIFLILSQNLNAFYCGDQAITNQSDKDRMVTCNILLQDTDDLKVDLDIGEDSYDINKKYSKHLRINNEDKIFEPFNKIARREYERAMEVKRVDARLNDKLAEWKIFRMDMTYNNRTSSGNILWSRLNQPRKSNVRANKVEYVNLKSEHFGDVVDDNRKPYDPVEIEGFNSGVLDSLKKITSFNISRNCTIDDLKGIGIKAIKCLINEFYIKQRDYKTLSKRLWKIATIWMVVYLVIAVPLWFIRGWCSWCLCCKFFHPEQTIQEAKNYLLLNPPGILVTKKGDIFSYEPTQRERDTYEEFDHFLKTL